MIRRLFNNRAFIIGLAICSGLLMLRSVAAPFLDAPDFSSVEDPEFHMEEDGPAELEVVASTGTASDVPDEDAIWRAEQSVLSGQLTWNGNPDRDPFSGMTEAPVVTRLSESTDNERMLSGIPRLDGLVAGPDSLFAVLNDRIVREGDVIGGYEVTRIATDGVRIASRVATHWLAVADMEFERLNPVTEAETDAPASGGNVDAMAGLIESPEPGG